LWSDLSTKEYGFMFSRRTTILIVVALLLGAAPAIRMAVEVWSEPAPAVTTGQGRELSEPVVMYSTQWCPYCQKAREYFKRHAVNYVEYDIEASVENRAKFQALGGTGVPLITVGDRRMSGFSPRAFNELLLK